MEDRAMEGDSQLFPPFSPGSRNAKAALAHSCTEVRKWLGLAKYAQLWPFGFNQAFPSVHRYCKHPNGQVL